MRGWADQARLTLAWGFKGGTINGSVGDCLRWFWWALYLRAKVEKYMDLKIRLVEKQNEQVEEGANLRNE